jgi:hypothetical protein
VLAEEVAEELSSKFTCNVDCQSELRETAQKDGLGLFLNRADTSALIRDRRISCAVHARASIAFAAMKSAAAAANAC